MVRWARDAGLEVSLDLIYGTPGESLDDWRRSVDAVLAEAPDHVSAYALIVEDGTKLSVQIRRGEVGPVDDDLQAAQYELADAAFAAAGYEWYEVSNWARDPAYRSRHNLAYWLGHDWWGVGPGAHSHVGGVRWWNVKHPSAYADRIAAGVSPAAAREVLDDEQRRTERVLLRTRIRDGLPVGDLGASGGPRSRRSSPTDSWTAGPRSRARWCRRSAAGSSRTSSRAPSADRRYLMNGIEIGYVYGSPL